MADVGLAKDAETKKVESGNERIDKSCEVNVDNCLANTSLQEMKQLANNSTRFELPKLSIGAGDEHVDSAREKFAKASENVFSESEFTAATSAFEKRARELGLSGAQVEETYKQLERIATATGDKPMTGDERSLFLKQYLQHLGQDAPPLTGKTDTCSWGLLQYRMMSKEPEIVTKMVADIATTGKFTTATGSTVEVDAESLRPDQNARFNDFIHRDYSAQVTQLGLLSLNWAAKRSDPDGNKSEFGELRYQQLTNPEPGDLGGRVYRIENGVRKEFATDNGATVGMGYLDNLQKVEALLVGEKGNPWTLYAANTDLQGTHRLGPKSVAELEDTLTTLGAAGELPAAMFVRADHSPVKETYLKRNPTATKAPESYHGVLIKGISHDNGKTNLVVYNPWGYEDKVPIETVFEAAKE
jgi:hypothetical protein